MGLRFSLIMTQSNSSEITIKKGKRRGPLRSAILTLLSTLCAGILLVVLALVWATTTTVGTRSVLSVASLYPGIKLQGVSGSLTDRLAIERIEFHHAELDVIAEDVEMQWQPMALLTRRIQLDSVRMNNVKVSVVKSVDESPIPLPASLKLPQPIRQLVANQLEVNHLQWSTRDQHQQDEKPQQFSAIKGRVAIDAMQYQLQVSGTTPWGSAAVQGAFETTSPFVTQAQFNWQGLPVKQNELTVPVTKARGSLSGNWKKLLANVQVETTLDHQVDTSEKKAVEKKALSSPKNSEAARGDVYAVLTPFGSLPIEALRMNLDSVNPVSFYADAPTANLQIKADLKADNDAKLVTLHGQFSIKNTIPMTWNSGGIPITKLNSEMRLNERQLSWRTAKIELGEGGLITSSGHLTLQQALSASDQTSRLRPTARLLELVTSVDIKDVNLLRIDDRLKKTQLNGIIQIENVNTGLQLSLDVKDHWAKNVGANLVSNIHLSHDHLVTLQKMELGANEARLSAHGRFALRSHKQEFSLQGEAYNLNPAQWIDMPAGNIAARFDLTGHLKQGWRVDAKVDELSGQFAGLKLQGESDVVVHQDDLLSIKKLNMMLGDNRFTAVGSWRLKGSAKQSTEPDQLKINVAIPDLSTLEPFRKTMSIAKNEQHGGKEKIGTQTMQGAVFIEGSLSGSAQQPSGRLNGRAEKLVIPNLIELGQLQAAIALAPGSDGAMTGNLDVTELQIAPSPSEASDRNSVQITHLNAQVSGVRRAHQLHLNAALPRKNQIALQAKGALQGQLWQGEVQQLDLSGASDLKLMSPFTLQVASQEIQMSAANWQGNLGKLQVQKMHWSRGRLATKGALQGLPVVNALKLWRRNLPLTGNLQLDAGWEFDVGQQATGQFEIKGTAGDITVVDISGGYSQSYALGLQNLSLTGSLGKTSFRNGTQARQPAYPIDLHLHAEGAQLGQINAQFGTVLSKSERGWHLASNAPQSGTATMRINDIQWMSAFSGPGVALRGELLAQAQLAGTAEHPVYSAQISGKDVQVVLTELGVLLPNGILEATLNKSAGSTLFKLDKLTFSQTIKAPPQHDQLTGLPWVNETGTVEASGEIDLQRDRGSIKTHWQRFPFLQTNEGWLVASGDAELTESETAWNLSGNLSADAAYFSIPKQAPPKLSSDVVVLKKNEKRILDDVEKAGPRSKVDFTINTGNNFVFVGRGLNTKLMGTVRIRMQNDGPVLATGSIQTVGGTYEGYGQQLGIERGILNFQGPVDRPNMNVRALRRGLPVEAGVEIVGTVAKPEVRLISEPNVPDQDKLSWLVLGRGADQAMGSDAGLLLSAASAIFGNDSDSNIPRDIAKTFGLDELAVTTVSSAPDSQLPSQTVAGKVGNSLATDQVFTVGKRITPDLVFSVERSLTDATNGVKLTWQLTRRFSIIGRAGSDTSVDAQYLFSFD